MERLSELGTALSAEEVSRVFEDFRKIRDFGSEIHTENSLIKPILKLLSFPYESKPRFFEGGVKDPDYALFSDEDEKRKAEAFWGQRAYYDHVLALLVLKRYGRNLWEGVSGYFLEFERRIPFYQLLYFLKKSQAKWGILTNGARWILVKRPVLFEKRFVEIDLERALQLGDMETFRLFSILFSLSGLKEILPKIEEEERLSIIGAIKNRETLWRPSRLKGEDGMLGFVEEGILKRAPLNPCNLSEICLHLLIKGERKGEISVERILHPCETKEALLSKRVLDMTPNFGIHFVQLVDGISYLSSSLPYKEPSRFVPEWEEEKGLLTFITEHMLFGIERSFTSLEIVKRTSKARYGIEPKNYKRGDPLLGIPLRDLLRLYEDERQPDLFFDHAKEALNRFIELKRQTLLLSSKIREEAALKEELEPRLRVVEERVRDILDTYLSTYFFKDVERGHVLKLLLHLEDTESLWQKTREKDWLRRAKMLSERKGFFHMELEFPFLLLEGFDLVIVSPGSSYLWEEERPFIELTKAYIKRASPYVKKGGRIVLLTEAKEDVLSTLSTSRRFEASMEEGFLLLTLKDQPPSHLQQ